MARLRLSITDDPKHQPDGVRVVGRQRFGWVALLAAYAALFCLPAFRNTMLDQAQMVTTGRPPEWLAGISGTAGVVGDRATERHRERMRRVLEKHPTDVELHLGALGLGIAPPPDANDIRATEVNGVLTPRPDRDPRLQYLAELRRQYPENPAVLATSLRYYFLNTVNIQRKFEHAKVKNIPGKDRFLAPAIAEEITAIASEGERTEPKNGVFASMAAAVHVAAGRDDEAVAALHRAAQCSDWKDYTWAEGGGAERLLTETYGDRGFFMHVVPLAAVLLPHYGQLRGAYQVLADRIDDSPGGWQLRADMLQVGALLRDGGETLIGRLVGAALQEIAFGTDDIHFRRGGTTDSVEISKQGHVEKLLTRAEKQAPAVLATLKREGDGIIDFRVKRKRVQGVMETWDDTLRPAVQRELLGLHLLGNLLGCAALWALTSLVLCAGALLKWPNAQALSERLSRPAYLTFIALSAGALLIPLGAAAVSPANAPYSLGLALFWLVFVIRPLLIRSGPAPAWHPALIASTAAAAVVCTLAALWPWEFATHTTRGYWMQQLGFLNLLGEWPSQEATNALGYVLAMGPAPLVIFAGACTAFAALWKRGVFGSWMEGTSGVARVLTAVLAVGYLVFTLVHAPATLRDGRIASQNFRNETAILDQR